MATDSAQIMQQPVAPNLTPPSSNDGANALVSIVGGELQKQLPTILDTAAQRANTVAGQAVAGVRGELTDLQAAFDAHKGEIAAQLAAAGGKELAAVTGDMWLTRVAVLTVLAAVLIGALSVLFSALAGNTTADHYVGEAAAAVVGIVLWISHAGGITLPTKPATKVQA